MVELTQLLDGLELTPGQLAELRAITSMYYTRLATSDGASSTADSELRDLVLARTRDMLRSDQQLVFDRNREVARSGETHRDTRAERHR